MTSTPRAGSKTLPARLLTGEAVPDELCGGAVVGDGC